MTTARSPKRVLKAQAKKIAARLKEAERGNIEHDPGGKIAEARKTGSINFAVAMDDKIIKIEMSWATIQNTSEAGIAQFILDHMREVRRTVH